MAQNLISRSPLLWVLIFIYALLPRLAVSARAPKFPKGYSTSFEVVKNPHAKEERIPTTELYASVFLKHKRPMPSALKTAWTELEAKKSSGPSNRRRATLSSSTNATSTVYTGGFYTALVRFGTPQQETYLMIDTGSFDVWSYTWLMRAYSVVFDLTGHHYYNATKSSTAVEMVGQSMAACYGGGCVYGDMWQDTVWIDSLGVEGNPVPGIWYEDVYIYPDLGVDGIFGLGVGMDSEYPDPQESWAAYVLPQLALPLFTVTLNHPSHGGGGSLDFGTINSSKYNGSIAYTPVTTIPGIDGLWAFNWSGFKIGNSAWNSSNIQFMTDTGSPISTFPPSVMAVFWAQVSGAIKGADGSWSYPCTSVLPDIYLGIGTKRVYVHGSNLVGGTTSGGYCFGAIQEAPEHNPYFSFGWQFFTSLFVVHDSGNNRMGFANRTVL